MSNQGFNEIMEATLTSAAKDKLIQAESVRYVGPRQSRPMMC